MKKDIKNYLHLYLPCEVLHCGELNMKAIIMRYYPYDDKVDLDYDDDTTGLVSVNEIKLLLRPLSDMTDAEKLELCCSEGLPPFDDNITAALRTEYLLSKRFDLFGLIEAELALDKTK